MIKLIKAMGHVLPWIFLLGLVAILFLNPVYFESTIIRKDNPAGAGFTENGTVLVLLVGIGFGIAALTVYRKRFPHPLVFFWTLGWVCACIYFAGEEASWGQWAFGWETPEVFEEINRQKETNLHNTSSWLNEKPRTMVEVWMILAGLLIPLFFFFNRKSDRSGLIHWLYPGHLGASAVLCFCLLKVIGFYKSEDWLRSLGDSEIRELYIAYFLSLYLVWLFFKLRAQKSVENPVK